MHQLRECMWCSRKFRPRTASSTHNHYALLSAGEQICWDCADLYEDAEIKLHLGAMKARYDESTDKVTTETGHELGLTIESWTKPRTPWGKPIGLAKDIYGKLWSIRPANDLATIKPIGA